MATLQEEMENAAAAMISCPVGAIHMRTPDSRLIDRAASSFPKEVSQSPCSGHLEAVMTCLDTHYSD
jgi:hypothetical protein